MVKVLNGFHYKELLMCYLDGFDIILKCYLLAIGFRFMNNSFYGISFSLKHFFFFFEQKAERERGRMKGHFIFIYFLSANFQSPYGLILLVLAFYELVDMIS